MRVWIVGLLLLGGCMSSAKDSAGMADELQLRGAWMGLDDAGEHWWRLQLDDGRVGNGAVAAGGGVARYKVTDWKSDAAGAVTVELSRGTDATALDRMPKSIRLTGKSDGLRMRVMYGKREIVFWREQRLLSAHKRLKKGMAAK